MGGDTNQWEPANLARNTTYIYPFAGKPELQPHHRHGRRGDRLHETHERALLLSSRSSSITCPAVPMRRITRPRSGSRRSATMHLFDKGWNTLREQIFANQKKLGVIPKDAKLTPWPKDLLKEWDQLTADEKKMFIRQADVFAAYVAYTDNEIGRVIQAVEDMGKLDNTLIIYIDGDNGTSSEGTLNGTPNEVAMFNSVDVPVEAPAEVLLRRLGLGQDLQPHGGAAGRGRSTRPSPGPSRSSRTSAACARGWRSPGRRRSRTRGVSATSSTMSSTSCRRSSKLPASHSRSMWTASSRARSKG